MLSCMQVVEDDEGPVAECTDLVAGLTRVTPDLELIIMAAHFVKIFLMIETKLSFPIVTAMVVVEQKIVVGGDSGQAIRIVEGRAPDLSHNILCKRI